ncbi:MAG: phosphoribosylformylglycinamidine synthase subunit PurS [archaeon]|nr:phosphoribosylformylglycinamidine synthase subunit PurS [Candidatus Micrarchaeota archaeon]
MWEIEVGYKEGKKDAVADSVKASIGEDLGIKKINSLRIIDVYRINKDFFETQVKEIAEKLFIDPITQSFSIDKPFSDKADWIIEVKFHEDVTDNVAIAAMEGVHDLTGLGFAEGENLRTAKKYLIEGKLSEKEVQSICKDLLANELIESFKYWKGKK